MLRFKTGPPTASDPPMNDFDVAGSALTVIDDGKAAGKKDKKYGFMIRFMQMTRFVERVFFTEHESELKEWVAAYGEVLLRYSVLYLKKFNVYTHILYLCVHDKALIFFFGSQK